MTMLWPKSEKQWEATVSRALLTFTGKGGLTLGLVLELNVSYVSAGQLCPAIP